MFNRDLSDNRLQLDSLDGLRGVAAFIVFLSHTSLFGMHLLPGVNFSGIGKNGVYLFFLLSAFLLTIPFLKYEGPSLNRGFFLNYAVRRFLRIYPLYALYLLIAVVVTYMMNQTSAESGVKAFPLTLSINEATDHLLLQAGKGVTWSIPVEFTYYLFLPFVALGFRFASGWGISACTALLVALLAPAYSLWPPSESLVNDIRLGPYLAIFFIGSYLSVLHLRWEKSGLSRNQQVMLEGSAWIAMLVQALMIPAILNLFLDQDVPRNYAHTWFLGFALLWAPVLMASVHADLYIRKILSSRACRYVGIISFSFYLWHLSVIEQLKFVLDLDGTLMGWTCLIAALALSHLTWFLVEKPFSRIRLKSR